LGSEGNCTNLVVGLGGGGGVRLIVDSFLTGVRRMDDFCPWDDDDDEEEEEDDDDIGEQVKLG